MRLTDYRVQYLCKGKWMFADHDSFLRSEGAKERINFYKRCGRTWEYRVVFRTVDYSEWEEVK